MTIHPVGLEPSAAARVGVTATVLWSSPDAPRPQDGCAITNVPDLMSWAEDMDNDDRHDLVGRADTHALLGEPVIVVSTRGGWAEVRLPDQPSSKAPDGYPGWIPTAHLVDAGTETGTTRAVVIGGRTIPGNHRGCAIALSFGTILPIVERQPGRVLLAHPDGGPIVVQASAVRLLDNLSGGAGAPAAVAALHPFVGVPYLWAGASGAGVDCSGLVHLAYRSIGVRVPRDADDQERAGQRIEPSEATPGDALFFANDGGVHHVALSIGGAQGAMLHAPQTGQPVQEGEVTDAAYRGETITAARFR